MPKGSTKLLILENVKAVMTAVAQLANLKVNIQQQDSSGNIIQRASATIKRSDSGMTISIPVISTSGGSSSTTAQVFGGNGPPTQTTLSVAGMPNNFVTGINPSIYVDETNDAIYFCSTAGTATTSVWTQLSQGGINSDALYTITAISSNFVTCTVGSTSTLIAVYKPLELQGGLTGETIDGTAITYSGYGNNFNQRVASDGTNTETQYITPRYTVGQIITARTVTAGTGGTFPSGTGFPRNGQFLLEYSPARQWGGND